MFVPRWAFAIQTCTTFLYNHYKTKTLQEANNCVQTCPLLKFVSSFLNTDYTNVITASHDLQMLTSLGGVRLSNFPIPCISTGTLLQFRTRTHLSKPDFVKIK